MNNNMPKQFSASLLFEQFAALESSKYTLYKHLYVDMCDGDLIAGILLSRIIYWFGKSNEDGKPRVRHRHNGRLCLVKHRSDWWEECRVSDRQYDRCIKTLKEKGYINTEIHKSPFHNNDTAIFIFINHENIMKMVFQLTENEEDKEPLEGNYQMVNPELPNGNSTITDRLNDNPHLVKPSYIAKTYTKNLSQQQQGDSAVVVFSDQEKESINLLKRLGFDDKVSLEMKNFSVELINHQVIKLESAQENIEIRNPLGWLRTAIENDWKVVDSKKEIAQKEQEKKEKKTKERQKIKVQCQKLYDQYQHLFTVQCYFGVGIDVIGCKSDDKHFQYPYDEICLEQLEKFITKYLKKEN